MAARKHKRARGRKPSRRTSQSPDRTHPPRTPYLNRRRGFCQPPRPSFDAVPDPRSDRRCARHRNFIRNANASRLTPRCGLYTRTRADGQTSFRRGCGNRSNFGRSCSGRAVAFAVARQVHGRFGPFGERTLQAMHARGFRLIRYLCGFCVPGRANETVRSGNGPYY